MLSAGRVISWVWVVTVGLTWTVGQAGVDSTERNLCELAAKIWRAPIPNCHIETWMVGFWEAGAILAVLFLLADAARWAIRRRATITRDAQKDHLTKIRLKFTSLTTEIIGFHAEEKRRSTPKSMAGLDDPVETIKERTLQRMEENIRQGNLSEASFMERFSGRIVDLLGELRVAGADKQVTQRPVWSFYSWPDSCLNDVGAEIIRLEQSQNETAKPK
jgi:hypothetical protein